MVVAGVVACAFAVTKTRLSTQRRSSFRTAPAAAQAEAKLAREDERQRIASDFHDGPLQSFISLQMRLEIVRKLLERDLKAGVAGAAAVAGSGALAGARAARLSAQHAAGGTWTAPISRSRRAA